MQRAIGVTASRRESVACQVWRDIALPLITDDDGVPELEGQAATVPLDDYGSLAVRAVASAKTAKPQTYKQIASQCHARPVLRVLVVLTVLTVGPPWSKGRLAPLRLRLPMSL